VWALELAIRVKARNLDSAENPSVHPSRASEPEFIEGTNGRSVEIFGDFSVHAEPVEAFLGFFSRIQFGTAQMIITVPIYSAISFVTPLGSQKKYYGLPQLTCDCRCCFLGTSIALKYGALWGIQFR
jgi:hypothetical protein